MSSDIKMDFGKTEYETAKLTEMAKKVEQLNMLMDISVHRLADCHVFNGKSVG
jgi:translation initiation factor IF-3